MQQVTIIISCLILLGVQSCQPPATSSSQETIGETSTNAAMYNEAHRNQFHFSPAENWMNDPNGMVYYEGEYHLFYQYYPDSNVWGPMHWAHAVSKDLAHWEHLPIGLYPDPLGYIFSGSAVVDWHNTSGFGKDGQPPLIAIFTHHEPKGAEAGAKDFQYQSIAYSNDKGRTWTKYEGNPVVPNTNKIKDFRDPKVIWDGASEQWIMAFAAYDHIKFWGSKNLKEWEHLSDWGKLYGEHGGVWECPDFFPMAVEGSDETKWVLLQSLNPGSPNGGSGTQYFVGSFDGKNFTLDKNFEKEVTDGKAVWLDYGRDNYAGVTWSDIPKEDGRRIFIGWMSNWDYAQVVPTEIWRSATTLARTLILKKWKDSYRVYSQPVSELTALRKDTIQLPTAIIATTQDLTNSQIFNPSQSELELEFDLENTKAKRFGIQLSNSKGEVYRMGFDVTQNQFFSDRTQAGQHGFSEKFATKTHIAPRLIDDSILKLQLFIDAAAIEVYADNGATILTEIFFPTEDFNQLSLFAEEGAASLKNGNIYALKRIW